MRLPPELLPKQWRKLKARPLVSIVIPVVTDVQDALHRVRQVQDLDAVEVQTAWFLDEDPHFEFYNAYHSNSKRWMTRELNKVFAESRGDFILLVEEGSSVSQEGIEDMIRQFGDFRVGLVGQELCLDGYPHIRRGCWMMTRRAYEQCGFFNPHIRSNGWNGAEIALRLQNAGYGTRQAQSSNVSLGEPEPTEGRSPKRNADYIRHRYGVTV